MGRSKNPRRNFTGDENITRIPPNVPVSRPLVQRPLGRGEQRFAEKLRRDREAGITRTPEEESKLYQEMVSKRKSQRRRIGRRMRPRPRPDDLGPPPEREVPIPKERIRPITRESDPRGDAPFAPDERGMARDRFFERMFDRADEEKQRRSMQKEERREVRQARNEERRARRTELGEIDVGGEIDIDRERGRRRRRRRDFTRRRSRMEGGRRGRSREERAAFRDRYVSTLR